MQRCIPAVHVASRARSAGPWWCSAAAAAKHPCRRADCQQLHESTVLSYSERGRDRTVMLAPDETAKVPAAVERYRAAQTDLVTGWVCAPGRGTITGMITVADPAGRRAHDAYHRFVRDGPGA